jgi:hypothetical protein
MTTHVPRSDARQPIALAAMLLSALAATARVDAQPSTVTLPLLASQRGLHVLTSGQPLGEAHFAVDDASSLVVRITTTAGGVQTSIEGPSGQLIDRDSVAGLGGEFLASEGPATASGILVLPENAPGSHQVYAFPSLGAGTYRVRFAASGALGEPIAVIIELLSDSPCGATLFVTEPQLVLGATAVLVAAVFDGADPVGGATVEVQVLPDSGPAASLTLRDDGADVDDRAGDGLYSGALVPSSAGRHRARAHITATAGGGAPFERDASADFVVAAPKASLTGRITDRGVDDDGDFQYDRIEVGVEAIIQTAGRYRVFVHLQTPAGRRIARAADAELAVGASTLPISFDADALRATGESGQYELALIELLFLGEAGAELAASLVDAGRTSAYFLSQFEASFVSLAGALADDPVDADGNGRYDTLRVWFDVDVHEAGAAAWSIRLTDAGGADIAAGAGSGFLDVGRRTLAFDVAGADLHAADVDGPYQVRELRVDGGARRAVYTVLLGQTARYRAGDFEGAAIAPPCAGDCDRDDRVAIAELVRGVAVAIGAQPLGDCTAMDTNGDGTVAVNELVAAVGSAIGGCP